ncbi:MAG TPA: acyl-CoA dehydrogenase family protein [Candidatus Binataceae bacterium]|nr:acyl-CoA dehydrogenase family protein [Candidatus Binataceae bacterium]
MSEITLIEETARRTIADGLTPAVIEAAEHGAWAGELWDQLAAQGLLQPAAIAQDAAEALEIEAAVIRAITAAATPLPVVETILAGAFLVQHRLEVPAAPLSLAAFDDSDRLSLTNGRVSGRLARVPWGRDVAAVVAVAGDCLLLLETRSANPSRGLNMANEPRDTLEFKEATPLARATGVDSDALLARCAAARALQLAEAAARVLELTVEYAANRKQFGRPIGNFQAIQHQIAAAASEVASARVAAQQARLALAAGKNALMACAIAKARANDAAAAVARMGHQVHGAIGFTQEYQLHRYTRRIQSWRHEFGASAYWNRRIGELILRDGERSVWSILTATA